MAIPEDKATSLMDLLKIPVEKRNFEELWDQIQNLIEEKDRFKRYYISMNDNSLEKILNNPGLQHLAEKIFDNLKYEDLNVCQGINQSSKQILDYQMDKPMFLLKKFSRLSKENQKDWIEVIQSVKNSDQEKAIISYLQWNLEKDAFKNLPCYSRPIVQDEFRSALMEICSDDDLLKEDIDLVKILAPLTYNLNVPDAEGNTPINEAAHNGLTEVVKILAALANPNTPNKNGETPIYAAASNGHTEIVKILVPLTDNPNAPDDFGRTPILVAACKGHTEIVQLLAPLTDSPNAPDVNGDTPIYCASINGHTEIIQILAPLTDNPNAPCNDGKTPIYAAASYGYTEIVKILAPLTDSPNAPEPDEEGRTPIHEAAHKGHTEIVKILAPLTENPNAPDEDGKTPISVAKNAKIRRILESFNTSRKRKSEPPKKPSKKRAKKF